MRGDADDRSPPVLRCRRGPVCKAHRRSCHVLSARSQDWVALARNRYVHHRHRVVVKHGGHIFRREFVRSVANEQARLTDSTVTDHNTSTRHNKVSRASTNGSLSAVLHSSALLTSSPHGRDRHIKSLSTRRGPTPSIPSAATNPETEGYTYLIVATTILIASAQSPQRGIYQKFLILPKRPRPSSIPLSFLSKVTSSKTQCDQKARKKQS